MEPDKYQQAWQALSSQTRVTVDANSLLKEVQSKQRKFRAQIFWRDFREVVVALVLIPVWFCLGLTLSLPGTWWLTVPVLLWLVGFMLVYRRRHMPKLSEPDQPLLPSVKNSLNEVEAQIWLLRNVFWWYLLPPSISISAFFVQIGWSTRAFGWLQALAVVIVLEVVLAVVYGALYFLNQYAVRSELEPERQELLQLLAALRDESTSKVSGEYSLLTGARHVAYSSRRMFVCVAAGVSILIAGLILMFAFTPTPEPRHDYPWKSPFAAVRWEESQPCVQVGDDWYKLVSLNGIPASEIVAFSRRTYGRKWQMRFEEDLVELLTRMGHPPQDKVTLVVQSLTSSQTRTLEGVPLTEANRRAIKRAANARETWEP
jgi:hypothetical protein